MICATGMVASPSVTAGARRSCRWIWPSSRSGPQSWFVPGSRMCRKRYARQRRSVFESAGPSASAGAVQVNPDDGNDAVCGLRILGEVGELLDMPLPEPISLVAGGLSRCGGVALRGDLD